MSARGQLIAIWAVSIAAGLACLVFVGVEAYAHITGLPEPRLHWWAAVSLTVLVTVSGLAARIAAGAKELLAVAVEVWKLKRGGKS